MRKTLVVVLGMLFVLGFAASAFAIHAEIPSETQAVIAQGQTQITLGGELRFRGELRKNNRDFNSDTKSTTGVATNQEGSMYDMRVRLSVEAKVTPNTTGFIQLESGDSDTADNVTWGQPNATAGTAGSRGGYFQGNGKKGDMRILQAWIQHQGSGLLGMPAGIKIGHMPLALGNGVFFRHTYFGDDAIVLFANPVKQLHLSLLTIKFRESQAAWADDADAYVALATYQVNKTTSFGFDVTYVNDQNFGHTEGAGLFPDIHLWNFGVRGKTEIAGFGINADVELQNGKQTDRGVGTDDLKYRGYAVTAGISYNLKPVKLTLDYAYGSGDDKADNKYKGFVTSLGNEQHFTYVYDYRTNNAANQALGGLANTQYFKLGANADVTKSLNVDLAGYVLRAAKKVYGANIASNTDSKNIGTEVDTRITYKIDRNLVYFVEGGYLWAGKFWKNAVISSSLRNPDDAYAVRHGITLSF